MELPELDRCSPPPPLLAVPRQAGRAIRFACFCRTTAHESSRRASDSPAWVHRSLEGLPLHYVRERDTYLVPLVEPGKDDIPFAAALELTAATPDGLAEREESSWSYRTPASPNCLAEGQDCFALRYMLDGQLQVRPLSSGLSAVLAAAPVYVPVAQYMCLACSSLQLQQDSIGRLRQTAAASRQLLFSRILSLAAASEKQSAAEGLLLPATTKSCTARSILTTRAYCLPMYYVSVRQSCHPSGTKMALQAGDSILTLSSPSKLHRSTSSSSPAAQAHTHILASSTPTSPVLWQAATLLFVLPADTASRGSSGLPPRLCL